MPDWRDAAWIAAFGTLLSIVMGKLGNIATWVSERRERARERRESQKTMKALVETIELKDMELGVKDRIILAMRQELDRRDRVDRGRNGGTP